MATEGEMGRKSFINEILKFILRQNLLTSDDNRIGPCITIRHCVIIIDRNAGEQLVSSSTTADGEKTQDTDKDDRPFPGPPKLAWMPTEDEESGSPSPDPEENCVTIELVQPFNPSPSKPRTSQGGLGGH